MIATGMPAQSGIFVPTMNANAATAPVQWQTMPQQSSSRMAAANSAAQQRYARAPMRSLPSRAQPVQGPLQEPRQDIKERVGTPRAQMQRRQMPKSQNNVMASITKNEQKKGNDRALTR